MDQKGTSQAEEGCKFGTRFEARLALVPVAMELVAARLRELGTEPEAVLRAELILEELFRNTILHGYRAEGAQPVWITARRGGFCYEDEAPAFNPLLDGPAAAQPNPSLSIAEQPVGGAGLLLIRQLAVRSSYGRVDGRNLLDIDVQ